MDAMAVPGRGTSRFPARAAGAIAAAIALALAAAGLVRFTTAGSGTSPLAAPVLLTPQDRLAAAQALVIRQPDDPAAQRDLGSAATQLAIATGDPALYAVATNALGAAALLAPSDERTTVLRGVLALSLHDFSHAFELGLQAHTAAPGDAAALGVMVDASVELGRYDEAADLVQQMLDRRPGAAALARASYLRELHGDLAGAASAMQQAATAAAASPAEEATMRTFLGDLHLAAGDAEAATAAYALAVRLSPTAINAAVGSARAAAATGDLGRAIALLEPVTQRSPVPATAALLGDLRTLAGDAAGAEQAYVLVRADERLLAAAGAAVDLELATFETDHGSPAKAVELARTAYATRRTIFTADALGWALTKADQASAALPYVEESLRLGTRSVPLRLHAATAFAATGDDSRAREQLAIAFTGSPWLAPLLRADAVRLADRLSLPVPEPWRA